ncbi:hypothetical protein [Paludifilum halophilum]|nr:hypothetical protein [Paludifilum halophilum]
MKTFKLGARNHKGRKVADFYEAYVHGDDYAVDDAVSVLAPYVEDVAYDGFQVTGIPSEEFVSYMYEAVFRAFENYEYMGASFTTFLSQYVNKAAVDVKTGRVVGGSANHYRVVTLAESNDGSDPDKHEHVSGIQQTDVRRCVPVLANGHLSANHFTELGDSCDVENDVVNEMMAEKTRSIIFELVESAPDKDRKLLRYVVKEMLDRPDLSLNRIAERYGVDFTTAKRALRRLGKRWDKESFGDKEDYMYPSCRLKPGKKTNGTSVPRIDA